MSSCCFVTSLKVVVCVTVNRAVTRKMFTARRRETSAQRKEQRIINSAALSSLFSVFLSSAVNLSLIILDRLICSCRSAVTRDFYATDTVQCVYFAASPCWVSIWGFKSSAVCPLCIFECLVSSVWRNYGVFVFDGKWSRQNGLLTLENEGTLFFRNVGNHSQRQYHCCAKLKRRKLVVQSVAYNLSSALPEIRPEYPVSWPSGWCLDSYGREREWEGKKGGGGVVSGTSYTRAWGGDKTSLY